MRQRLKIFVGFFIFTALIAVFTYTNLKSDHTPLSIFDESITDENLLVTDLTEEKINTSEWNSLTKKSLWDETFTIRYPQEWSFREADTDSFSLLIFDPPDFQTLRGSVSLYQFSKTATNLDPDAEPITFEERFQNIISFMRTYASYESIINVGSIEALQFKNTKNPFFPGSDSLIDTVLLESNQIFVKNGMSHHGGYLFAYRPVDPYWDNTKITFGDIISTFQIFNE
jgi:hypothetical protein